MPFGRKDCDDLYKNQILPTLRKLKINPIRVDQEEHKEDLNVFIVRMIEESDIVIADLTYARPSVYYEAGFAERAIPIAYISRKDHLGKKQIDDNLRVHFDLEMKKIIPWESSKDPAFRKRLERRLCFLIRPLRIKEHKDELLQEDRKRFSALSLNEKLDAAAKAFQCNLRQKHFWICPFRKMGCYIAGLDALSRIAIGAKLVHETCHLCIIIIKDSFIKKTFMFAINQLAGSSLVYRTSTVNSFVSHFFFCSIKNTNKSVLTTAIPDAVACDSGNNYTVADQYRENSNINIKLLNNIDSFTKIRQISRGCFADIPGYKTNRYTFLVGIPGQYPQNSKIYFSDRLTPRVKEYGNKYFRQLPESNKKKDGIL
jgi:nucleoside 2-deoxyribosyltransferase